MLNTPLGRRLRPFLDELYGAERVEPVLHRIIDAVDRHDIREQRLRETHDGALFHEKDVLLITYGDQVKKRREAPLVTLRRFLLKHALERSLSAVHILPFYPYSSDDGFSVINYRMVDPSLGSWYDVEVLAEHFDLMFDLVLNHISSRSSWFVNYLDGDEPWCRFFHEVDPQTDLTAVVRPRSLPLLTAFETSRGQRHVWTTFSEDQIDLNYSEPEVLIEMVDVMLGYLARGARILRLDAIAYLWKDIGTSCINDPRTHTVVKLLRAVAEEAAPGSVILTETNLPHAENVSYFGHGDEAHMVYQFSLPPLLLDAMTAEDAGAFVAWLTALEPPPPGTTFLNFTASHDGVGVRPLEGLVPEGRVEALVDAVRERGGQVSTRRRDDGRDVPYELNIGYLDAVGKEGLDAELHRRRFLTTQAVMLALRGVPAVYFHSLVGTPNDLQGMTRTGRARSINRRRYEYDELHLLVGGEGPQAAIFAGYRALLAARTAHPAFHPDAAQQVWPVESPAVASFVRTAADGDRILVSANFSGAEQRVDLPSPPRHDLLADAMLLGEEPRLDAEGRLLLAPYQTVWLTLDDYS